MSILLHIESSANLCSVALSKDDTLLDYTEGKEKNSHAQMLLPFIDALLADNNIARKKLSAVSISAGPGSYTGLRIGTATAKAICSALNIPLIAISTLEALAYAALQEKPNAKHIIPMIDARRMEVYTAVYDNKLNELQNETAIDFASTEFYFPEKAIYFGNGAEKLSSEIEKLNGKILSSIDFSAKNQIALTYQKYQNKDFCDLPYFEPNYIKNFQLTMK